MVEVKFHQKAIIFNQDGKLLALLRSYTNKKWDLPGGAVEIPENHEAALLREIQEETGLVVSGIRPMEVQTAKADDGSYLIFIGFTCTTDSTAVVLSHEHTDYRWVDVKEFLSLDATQYLKDFVSMVRKV